MNTHSMSKVRIVLSSAVVAFAAFAASSYAQTPSSMVRVQVPFSFQNGSEHLGAGEYMISKESDHIVIIQGRPGTGLSLVRSEDGLSPAKSGKLVFRQYGDQYFLREIWVAGSTTHLECPKSKAEKHAQAEQLASSQSSNKNGVEVAVLEDPR